MAILGQEAILEAALTAQIQAEIAAKSGTAPTTPNAIDGLSSGIAKALIPFLVSNMEVVAGIDVLIPATGAPGTPSTGSTIANGLVT